MHAESVRWALLLFALWTCAAAAAPRGRVVVSPGGRTLRFEDGTPFVPLGHTEAFSFFNQIMNDRATLDRFLAAMHAGGQNLLVVQVENNDRHFFGNHPSDLQFPLGTFHEPIARMFDDLLDLAEQHDIQIVTYLFDTFHMDFAWGESPWNRANGGPCVYVSDFLRSPAAFARARATFDYAIRRWGRRRNLLGIELLNEHDWAVSGPLPGNKDARGHVHGATLEESRDWHLAMARYVRAALDAQAGGGARPLLMSSSNNPNFGRGPDGRPVAAARWFFECPDLDLVAFHGYIWPPPTGDADAPLDLHAHGPTTDPAHPLDAFGPLVDAVSYLTRNTDKPVLGTEEGPLGWWIKEPRREPTFPGDDFFFDVMAWSELTAGAAGPGLRWPYPNFGFSGKPFLNPLSGSMQRTLAAIGATLGLLDLASFAPEHRPDAVKPTEADVLVSAAGDSHQLLAWIAADTRRGPVLPRVRALAVSGLADEPHEVLWIHDRTGVVLARGRTSGPAFTLSTPRLARSLALVVRPLAK